jgi:hypothetical protein
MNFKNTDDYVKLLNDSDNTYLKDLLDLSKKSDVSIIAKKNKQWKIKDTRTILRECTKQKQKEIKNTSGILANLAKYCKHDSLTELKKVNTILETKIHNIDLIINHINTLPQNDKDLIDEDYIECYSN